MAKTVSDGEPSRADVRRPSAERGGLLADGLIRGALRRPQAGLIWIEPDAAAQQETV